jgi:hypothetical protein
MAKVTKEKVSVVSLLETLQAQGVQLEEGSIEAILSSLAGTKEPKEEVKSIIDVDFTESKRFKYQAANKEEGHHMSNIVMSASIEEVKRLAKENFNNPVYLAIDITAHYQDKGKGHCNTASSHGMVSGIPVKVNGVQYDIGLSASFWTSKQARPVK